MPEVAANGPFQAARLTGLTEQDARLCRERFGTNLLPRPAHPVLLLRFLSQLVHFFAVMLWVAGALAMLAGMPQLGLAIFVVTLLNGPFAFFQEYRAEKAGERLHELLPRRVTVIRDSAHQNIDVSELVPGDLVAITAGDRIPADMRVIEAHGLCIDTSTLTGESIPASPPGEEMIFAGTFATEGDALASLSRPEIQRAWHRSQKTSCTGRRPQTPSRGGWIESCASFGI